MRTIYQNLNVEKHDCERVEMIPCGSHIVQDVVFRKFEYGTRVRVMVPWQHACQYWRASGYDVDSVVWQDGSTSFAKWYGMCAKYVGVVSTWYVGSIGGTPLLQVDIDAPYLQAAELGTLKSTPRY